MNEWHKKCFYRVSVKALIRNEHNQILMVKENAGNFSLPGGGWDYEENLHECLARELGEEIALSTDFTERIIAALPFYNPNKEAWQMWIACEIQYDELQFGIGEDADEVKWVDERSVDFTTMPGTLIAQVLKAVA